MDKDSPIAHGQGIGSMQPDVVINAGAGVPPAIFFLRVIGPYRQFISAVSKFVGEIYKKRGVAVGLGAVGSIFDSILQS